MTPQSTVRRNRRQAAWVAVLCVLAAIASACGGSAVPPEKAVAANNALHGFVQTASGTGASPVGPVGEPGAPTGGTGVPGTPGSIPVTSGGSGTGGTVTVDTPGAAPATGKGVKAGSCAGFKNTTGITDSAITVASMVDVSGPVPGIFKPAGDATKAYALYFNSTSRICGRKLEVKVFDTQTNTSGDAVAMQKACDETFASVGSIASFDQGGAAIATKCGIPEIRSIILNKDRAACPTCFSAQAPSGGVYQSAVPDYFTKLNKEATQHAAMLYVNVSASADAAKGTVNAQQRRGWKFGVVAPFDIAEFNYGPYVQRMKSAGVRIVQMLGSTDMALRMARAMQAANFKPDYFLLVGTQYDPAFAAGGSAAEGSIIYVDFTPIEEASTNAELALYMRWLQQVVPGATPTYFGLYAWSAARLFAEQATILGGKLNRATLASRLRGVRDWTANGLHAPQSVGAKVTSQCWRFLQVKNGKFVPYGPVKYQCGTRVSMS